MKISFTPINFNYNSQKPASQRQSLTYRTPLACDSVSFGAHIKKSLLKEIETFGEENIPEPILQKAKNAIKHAKDEGISLFSIHQEHYKALENSKTIEEVKEIYPEFKNVKQVSELEFNKSRNSTANQIKLGEIQGLTPEDTSLMLLKHTYCGSQFEGLENLSQSATQKLKTTLSIPGLEKRYAAYMLSSRRHTNAEFREQASKRMKAQRQDAAFNAKSIEASSRHMTKLNQDPDFAKRRDARTSEMHRNPEYAAKRDENIRIGREKLNSSPELRAKQIEATRRKSKEVEDIQSEASTRTMIEVWAARPVELQGAQKELAKEFPRLGKVLTKKRMNQPLDEADIGYLKLYYSVLYERYPELRIHLSKYRGEAYRNAYSVVKNEYEKAISQGRLEELLESWKKAKK